MQKYKRLIFSFLYDNIYNIIQLNILVPFMEGNASKSKYQTNNTRQQFSIYFDIYLGTADC